MSTAARFAPTAFLRRLGRAPRGRNPAALAVAVLLLLTGLSVGAAAAPASAPRAVAPGGPGATGASPGGAPPATSAPPVSLAARASACQPAPDPAGCLTAGTVRPLGAANGTVWTNLTTYPEPPNLLESTMTYDVADGYVVLFGGFLDGTNHTTNQTWIYNASGWTNITSTAGNAPSPRFGMNMTYDGGDGYVLAYGGWLLPGWIGGRFYQMPTRLNDTWEFDGGRWSPVNVSCNSEWNGTVTGPTTPGLGGCQGMPAGSYWMVYDARDNYTMMGGTANGEVMGGGAWIYRAGVWTDIVRWPSAIPESPGPPGPMRSFTYDAAAGEIVGVTSDLVYNSTAGQWVDGNRTYTFTYANNTWTNVTATVTGAPPPRIDPAIGYDSETGEVLLYGGDAVGPNPVGGLGGSPPLVYQPMTDTWAFANGTWTNVTRGTSGGPQVDAQLLNATGLGTELLVGGYACAVGGCHHLPLSWCWTPYNPVLLQTPYEQLCNDSAIASAAVESWDATPPTIALTIAESRSATTVGAVENFTADFLGGNATVLSFAWQFGDGANATTRNASHTYLTAGTYRVTAWVNETGRDGQARSLVVVVNAAPSLASRGAPDPTDVGLPVAFVAGRSNGTAPFLYLWTFGDGTSSDVADPVHTYATNGSFFANLTVVDAAGVAVNTSVPILVHVALNVSLNVTPTTAELGQLVNFSANASGGTGPYTFAWSFGDGGLGGNVANISHVYTTDGPFAPAVTVTDSAGQVVTVSRALPVALNVSAFSSGFLGASPLGISFSSRVAGGHGAYAYAWSFGDGTTSAQADPTHLYTTPGTFTAELSVTDANGDVARGFVGPILVAAGGGALHLSLSPAQAVVPLGDVETLTAAPSGGSGAYALAWTDVPEGCSAASALTLQCRPSISGRYAVNASLTDASGASVTALTTFTVGGTSSPGTPGPTGTGPVGGGTVPLAVAAAAGAAGGVALAAAVVLLSRPRDPPRERRATDPYERFRRDEPLPGDAPAPPEAGASAPSLPDLL